MLSVVVLPWSATTLHYRRCRPTSDCLGAGDVLHEATLHSSDAERGFCCSVSSLLRGYVLCGSFVRHKRYGRWVDAAMPAIANRHRRRRQHAMDWSMADPRDSDGDAGVSPTARREAIETLHHRPLPAFRCRSRPAPQTQSPLPYLPCREIHRQ